MPAAGFIPGPGDSGVNKTVQNVSGILGVLQESQQLGMQKQFLDQQLLRSTLENEALRQQNAAFDQMNPLEQALAMERVKQLQTQNEYAPRLMEAQITGQETQNEGNALQNALAEATQGFSIDLAKSKSGLAQIQQQSAQDDYDWEKQVRAEAPRMTNFILSQYPDRKVATQYKGLINSQLVGEILRQKDNNDVAKQEINARLQQLDISRANSQAYIQDAQVRGWRNAAQNPGVAAAMLETDPNNLALQAAAKYAPIYAAQQDHFNPWAVASQVALDPDATENDKIGAFTLALQASGQKIPTKKVMDPDSYLTTTVEDSEAIARGAKALERAAKTKAKAGVLPTTQPAANGKALGSSADNPIPVTTTQEAWNLKPGTWYKTPTGRILPR